MSLFVGAGHANRNSIGGQSVLGLLAQPLDQPEKFRVQVDYWGDVDSGWALTPKVEKATQYRQP